MSVIGIPVLPPVVWPMMEASKAFLGFAIALWPNPGFVASSKARRFPLTVVLGQLTGWAKPMAIVMSLALVLEIIALLACKSQFGSRITSLVTKYFDLKMHTLQLERVSDFIIEPGEMETVGEHPEDDATPLVASVRLQGLSFRYGEHEKEIFVVDRPDGRGGRVGAIAGPSGCGKSTLMQVTLGVFPPTKGQLLIGGVDVGAIGTKKLRDMIGTVMQDDDLFAGTIAALAAAGRGHEPFGRLQGEAG